MTRVYQYHISISIYNFICVFVCIYFMSRPQHDLGFSWFLMFLWEFIQQAFLHSYTETWYHLQQMSTILQNSKQASNPTKKTQQKKQQNISSTSLWPRSHCPWLGVSPSCTSVFRFYRRPKSLGESVATLRSWTPALWWNSSRWVLLSGPGEGMHDTMIPPLYNQNV